MTSFIKNNFTLLKKTFYSILCVYLSIVCYKYVRNPYQEISSIHQSYDYIIVGGGTAGCVVANQLSEIDNAKVLLIEAGEEFSWLSKLPIAPTLLQRGAFDWSFNTVPQKTSSFGLINKVQFLPRGKGLGGSGQINYFLHGIGKQEDFDVWMDMGATNWNYSNISPFIENTFIHSACFENNIKQKKCSSDKNYQGVIHLSENDDNLNELIESFITASKQLQKKNLNVEPFLYTIFNGYRESTYEKFLKPNLYKSNLHILTNAIVTKVNFKDNIANSVNIKFKNNEVKSIKVHKEIILSCGAIQTPQLLMISGIGPRALLKQHNIKVVSDLDGVGKNLHDHFNMPLYVSIKKPLSITLDKIKTLRSILDFFVFGKGYLSTPGVVAVGKGNNHESVMLFALGSTDEQILREIANTKSETFRAFFPFYNSSQQEGLIFLNSCMQPRSRGKIILNDDSIENPPIIDPMYLHEEYDIRCIISAIRLTINIVNTPIFKNMGAKIQWPKIKECKKYWNTEINNDYLECITRHGALTGHHIAGTCSMAGNSSVVDGCLQVNGVKKLRIVDASIFPTPISSPPNSILIAIAKRAAQFIKTKSCGK